MKKLITFFAAVLLGSIGLHAERAITYYSFNRLYYKNGSLDIGATTFGPAITNHDFSYGVGTIVCNGEITKIGTEAFFECSNLDSIEIPSSVITIEQSAFDRCNNLKKVTMSGSVTSIGSWAFDACSALTSIVIPNSVTTIGAGAFNGCNNLTSVTIGSSVTSIKSEAFAGCKGLTSIEIPNSVVSIGDWTFNGCSGLTTVKMNWTDAQSIASISSNVFQRIARGAGPQGAKLYVPAGTYNLYHQADVWKDFGVIVDTDNKITYTASAQLTGAQFNVGATTFGSGIFSHTFSNGTGTIICDGPITTIGANAFNGCTGLTSITIPNSVTTIEAYAFYDCSNLPSITIPNSVKTIGADAFHNSGLTSVEIPSSVTSIGGSAFRHCTGLSSVTVNWTDAQSIVSISIYVFEEIANSAGPAGATLVVPTGTYNLYHQANVWKDFGGIVDPDNKLTYTASAQLTGYNGSLNKGATTFGPRIFSHTFSNGTGTIICDGLITTIGDYAFYDCSGLTSIVIPNSVTTIGEKAFYKRSGLTSITIPQSVTTIGETAFEGSSTNLTSIVVASGNPKYDSRDNCNAIVETATNTLILGCKNTTIPNNITTIGRSAFDGCSDLKDITLPNSVTTIGRSAFWNCKSLTSITIPNAVTTIGMNAFAGAGLTFITIPASVKEINEHAFWDCTSLSSVKVSWTDAQSIVSINSNVFQGIANNAGPQGATLYVPKGTLNLYNQANGWKDFGSKVETSTITYTATAQLPGYEGSLDKGKTTFGPAIVSHTFSNGQGTIVCAGEITMIDSRAFYGCDGLTSINIPNSVKTIGESAFYKCYGLTSIIIPNSVKTIVEYVFFDCIGLKSIEIPNSVIEIKYRAFAGCTGLTSINIPNSVKTIGNAAFYNCDGLTSIEIPNSVTTIESSAFYNCGGLTSVTVSWTDPQSIVSIDSYVFDRIANYTGPSGATLYVPKGTLNLYNQANGWKDFGRKVELGIITYTASAQLPGHNGSLNLGATTFGSPIVSHNFSNGVGMIMCNGEITTIEKDAFSGCSGLTSITIPNSVTTIGNGAFYNCTALTSVIVNWTNAQSIVPISRDVFTGIANSAGPSGATLHVPTGAINLYRQANVWKDFGRIVEMIIYTASAQLTGAKFNVGATTFGSPIIRHTFSDSIGMIICDGEIIKIETSAFQDCSGLTSITIPTSVKEIKDWAFKNCTNLKDLDFAERERTDAITVGKYAIENTALEAVAIPEWMAVVPEGLFYSNKKLRAIYLPANVSQINLRAFEGCDSVKCVVSMAATPPTLGADAFVNFKGKNDVFVYVPSANAMAAYQSSNWKDYFPNFTTDIEYQIIPKTKTAEVIRAIPFDGKVAIPAMAVINGDYYTVIGIGNNAFKNDTSLRSISLPPSIQYIGNDAFNGCTQLKQTSIETLEDLQTIGYYAFHSCGALDSIVIPEGVQTLDAYTFYGCSSLRYVRLPESLKKIENHCFRKCPLGPEIIIPEGVETIGVLAFEASDNAINSEVAITLPSTLKEIKTNAFFSRNKLKSVTCLATNPPTLENGIFTNTDTAIVYVPNRDVVQPYKNSSWKNYKFKFSDLMAEQNKKYLYVVAGENKQAQDIAKLYCDSIDRHATTAQQVQDYTNRALEKIDKLTLVDYKQALADSLERHAGNNAEAKQIAGQYVPQIINAYFRDVAERIFAEGDKKIGAIFELIALKEQYCTQLKNTAQGDSDMEKVADSYSTLIRLAETKEEARALYDRATMRMTINRQINTDWQGVRIKVNNHECTTTRGYIYY